MFRASLVLILAFLPALAEQPAFRLDRVHLPVRYVDYEFAVQSTPEGVPKLDMKLFRSRPAQVVTREREALVLENRHLRVTVIPSMGRLHSFVHKPSGNEQFWINPAAIPIGAHNDTGFWVVWGGMENVMPRGEHGTSHALRWNHAIESDTPSHKAVRMWTVEPLTGLEHSITYAIHSNRRYLEATISIRNPGTRAQRFSNWTTVLLAPGGLGEITAKTEFIVPAERFVPADKPFNKWMEPLLGPARTSALRFAGSWKGMGDLMATPLERPFYAAYSPEKDEAFVHLLDLAATPGFNIWTWGFPLDEKRQRAFTAEPPNAGYAEFWIGTVRDYDDESLKEIGPGQRITWTEKMCAVGGVRKAKDRERFLERACEGR